MAPADLLKLVRLLVASIGVAGVFYAVGFVIETSHQDLLGVLLPSATTSEYVVSAGRLGLDTLLFAARWLGSPVARLGGWAGTLAEIVPNGAVLILVALVIIPFFRRVAAVVYAGVSFLHSHPVMSIAGILAATVASIGLFALPILTVDRVLFRKVPFAVVPGEKSARLDLRTKSFGWTGPLEGRARTLYADFVCAHIPDACPPIRSDISPPPARMMLPNLESVEFRTRIENRFLAYEATTALLLALAVVVWKRPRRAPNPGEGEQRGYGSSFRTALWTVLGLSLAVDVLLVPYTYGKTVRSLTAYREVVVDCAMDVICLKTPAGDENARGPDGGAANNAHGYVLAQTDKAVILFERDTEYVWEIPLSSVKLMKVEKLGDVFAHMAQKLKTDAEASAKQDRRRDGGGTLSP